MFPLNMTAAMQLTVLVSLLTVTVCSEATVFSVTTLVPVATTNASQLHSNSTLSSTVKATTVTPQVYTSTHPTTSDGASVAPQTTRAEETSPSNTTLNTTTTQTSNGTLTVPSSELLNVTAITKVNSTSSGLSSNWGKDDLATNPGLVAVLCIFCIVLALSLVVIMVKCIRSPRSNFEKLEDMPMGKVNEESPFAQYSK